MTLEELKSCGRPWAERRAAMALRIQEDLALGRIDRDEAQELIEDLQRTDRIDREADSIELKAALISALALAAKAI